jgi:chromosome segregation ATPase
MADSNRTESYGSEAFNERLRSVQESLAEFKNLMKEFERRVRSLETDDIDQMRKSIYRMQNEVDNFKLERAGRKENWSVAMNFVVQLIWVVIAAYTLHKLGIDMGPL